MATDAQMKGLRLMIKGAALELSPEDKVEFDRVYAAITEMIASRNPGAVLALALVGAELQE